MSSWRLSGDSGLAAQRHPPFLILVLSPPAAWRIRRSVLQRSCVSDRSMVVTTSEYERYIGASKSNRVRNGMFDGNATGFPGDVVQIASLARNFDI